MPMQILDRRTVAGLVAISAAGLIGAGEVASAAAKSPTTPAKATAKTLRWAAAGNRSLGTVKLTADSVVRWTDKTGAFSVRDASGKLKGSSKTVGGETFVARGTYRKVTVAAKGSWTLTVTPLPASHR